MVIAMLLVILMMAVGLQKMLERGHERALAEQSETSSSLAFALEDSTVRSVQAVIGALETIAENAGERSATLDTIKSRFLRGMPQLRYIDIVPLDEAGACTRRLSNTEVLFLPAQSGRFWGDSADIQGLTYWPICVPYRIQNEIAGYVIGSVNLNYYTGLFQAVSNNQRQVALYLFSGEKVVGEGDANMSPVLRERLLERSWGELRSHDTQGEYLESYRGASFYPLIISIRSYNQDALDNWLHDARLVRSIFSVLAILLLMMLTMYLMFKHHRDKVQGDNHLLSMAIRSAANAIFITDPKGRIEWVNEAFTTLTGYRLAEVRHRTPRILNSGFHDKPFFTQLWQTISNGQNWRNELVNRHKSGQFITVEQTVTPILDNKGDITHFIAVHEDVTVRKEVEQQVLYMARHDDLTGLTNRRYFEQCLEDRVADRQHGQIALLFIDLDRFKDINDTLGHEAGDVLLKRVANTLSRLMPDETLLSRLGGDEFALFLHPVGSEAQIHSLAKNIVSALATPFEFKGTTFAVSCSVGVAMSDIDCIDASSLLRQADLAMYRAKHAGKNTYRFFDETMDERMQRRVAIQQYVEEALQDPKQLMLYYQPQLDGVQRSISGVEVLLRWQRQGEWLSPAEFIPILEDSGQIVELGRWVMESALMQMADWIHRGVNVGELSINLSAVQLSSSDVALELIQLMEYYDIPSSRVAVEFTETTLMVRSAQLTRNLATLRAHQIKIAVDDFGTGYCSLSYLRELEANYLKIDQSFVKGIGEIESDECIVSATIAMAKGLNMHVIAEGVETQQQAQYLVQHGCDFLQGYGFAHPMPAEALETWLIKHAQHKGLSKA